MAYTFPSFPTGTGGYDQPAGSGILFPITHIGYSSNNLLGGISINQNYTGGSTIKPANYNQNTQPTTDDPLTGGTGNSTPISDPDEHEGLVRQLETKINPNAGYGPKLRNRKLVSVEDLWFLLDVFDNVEKYYTGYSQNLFKYETLDQIVNGASPQAALGTSQQLIVDSPYTQEGQDREKEEQKAQAAAKSNNWLLWVGVAIVLMYAKKS